MKKIFSLVLLLAALAFAADTAVAKNQPTYAPGSEDAAENGDYDVEGRPDLKVKVFVYKAKFDAKRVKPTPQPPALVCDLTDPGSNAQTAPLSWGATLPATWTYNLNSAGTPAWVGAQNWPVIVSNALAVWKNQIGSQVDFQRGSDTSLTRAQLDGKNIVAWGRASGSTLAVSYLWYYPATGKMAEVDTIMNKSFPWAWSDPSAWGGQICAYQGVYDAQNILTHEFGHTMGLDDHYDPLYADNTMYGYGSPTEVKKDTLTLGDIAGLMRLYR